MELKTEALSRVLDALSPALSEELDRLIRETREAQEAEFEKRLADALSEAQSTAQDDLALHVKDAVTETQEIVRKQVAAELEGEFRKTLEDRINELNSQWATERSELQEKLDQWRVFSEAQQALLQARTQSEMLARFLRFADRFVTGIGIYVAKPEGLGLWKSRGTGTFPETISEQTKDPEFYFRAVPVRGKTVAAVYAAPPFRADAIDFLVSSLARAVEIYGLKLQSPLPAAAVAVERTVAMPTPGTSLAGFDPGDEDQKVHAEALRTARLLISEIKLYNEQAVREGQENHDIYERLQKEIDHGREMYSQRVPDSVLTAHDYFHEELVRILGESDPSRLGAAYPGPMNS